LLGNREGGKVIALICGVEIELVTVSQQQVRRREERGEVLN